MATNYYGGATTPEGQKIDSFVNAATKILGNLWSRWQDEKEYEDINDYAKPLVNLAKEHGIESFTMTKRPFGCKIPLGGKVYQVAVTGRSLTWRRIK